MVQQTTEDFEGRDKEDESSPNFLITDISDISLLTQDIAAYSYAEINDIYSTIGGTQGASMGHDKFDDASYHRTAFLHFGTVDIDQCQKLNEGWQERARQTKLVDQQAELHPRQIHDAHYFMDDGKQRFSHPKISLDVDHFFGGDVDLFYDTCSESATQELSLMGDEGIYSSSLELSPITYDMESVYLLVGDLIFIDSLVISGCPTWVSVALSDLAGSTTPIKLFGSVWRHVYLLDLHMR